MNRTQRDWMSGWAALVLAALAAGCERKPGEVPASGHRDERAVATGSVPGMGEVWFEEVAGSSGIRFQHSSGHRERFLMPEINTGGAAILDVDNDGWQDVFCVNGGFADPSIPGAPGHRLFRNLKGWKFEDITEKAGVGGNAGYGMGVACGDFDGDGWIDLYVLNLRANVLYRNRGDGTFEDVTARAGVGGDAWSSSAAFFDFDRDGDLDLFVANYLNWTVASEVSCSSRGGVSDYCSPLSYRSPALDRLYRNRGDGTFEDVSEAMGIHRADGYGLGVATGDFDRDGWLDVFVANDATPNQLWMNRGGKGFVDEALMRGCALNAVGVPRAGMGVVAIDLRGRGWLDIFVTHLVGEGNGWFVNEAGRFSDRITPGGPMRGSLAFTGFGVGFRDFDHDGELDLYVANGRVRLGARDLDGKDPYAEPNSLLRGLGGGDFEVVSPVGGTQPPLLGTSRGLAIGDLDNDGAEDLVVVNKDGPVHVLRNRVGNSGTWLGLDVREVDGREVRNAWVRVDGGGRHWERGVQPNEGYAASHDSRLVIGLGRIPGADRVVIRWLDGVQEDFGPLKGGTYHRVRRGAGTPAVGDARLLW